MGNPRMPAALLAVCCAAALGVSGCGGSGSNASYHGATSTAAGSRGETTPSSSGSNSSASKLPGFLATAPNGAVFIQMQRQGSAVSGKLSESYFDQTNPTQLQAQADSFTGSITGSQISLSLDTGDTWAGTLKGSELTLSYTGSDGSIQTLDFHAASAAAYNAAVARTKQQVNGAAATQQQQQATASAQQQVDGDASGLASAYSSVQQDIDTVNGDGFTSDLAQMRADVGTTYKDLQTTLSDHDASQLCADSSQTDSDETQVESDQTQVQSDIVGIQSDLMSLSSDLSTLEQAAQTYTADQAVVPNYIPATTPPTATQISQVESGARRATTSAHARSKSATATASQLVAQAKGYSSQGDRACNQASG